MTLKDDTDTAIATLQSDLDSMGFLDPGARTAVDEELVAQIQADLDALVEDYGAVFSTTWGGHEHEPTAEEMAHWLFDDHDPSEHRLSITVAPTSQDERLTLVFDVPRS